MYDSIEASGCPEAVIGAIYENLDGEDPWGNALEGLRHALRSNYVVLRIFQRNGTRRETLVARGLVVEAEDVRKWEEIFAQEGPPVSPRCGEMAVFNWHQWTLRMPAAKQLIATGACLTLWYNFECSPEGECTLIVSRDDSQPAFNERDRQLLTSAASHFQRVFRLRQEIIRNRLVRGFQAEALERLAIGGYFIGQNRSTQLLNSRATCIIEERDGLKIVDGLLHATDKQDDRALQGAIRAILGDSGDSGSIRGLSLRRSSGKRDLGVIISAQPCQCLRTSRAERGALIFVRDPESITFPSISLMQELFSFTRAEAAMASRLAKGMRLGDIEHELNIRHNTARAHLRAIFTKAEVHRQSQLVHLLANCVAPLGLEAAASVVRGGGRENRGAGAG